MIYREAQIAALVTAGMDRVFREDRPPRLRRLLDQLDAGDMATSVRLDRLAQSESPVSSSGWGDRCLPNDSD
jgi:hypothetical protein